MSVDNALTPVGKLGGRVGADRTSIDSRRPLPIERGERCKTLRRPAPGISMHQSHVIEVAGQFAGAVINHEGRFRFIAVDPRVEELDDSLWPSLPDVQRVVGHLLSTGRLPPAPSEGGARLELSSHSMALS